MAKFAMAISFTNEEGNQDVILEIVETISPMDEIEIPDYLENELIKRNPNDQKQIKNSSVSTWKEIF